ncbi:MAG: phosphoenolpyruvate carboxykinase [Methanomassiliicoccales archaeon]|nr:phosphoenolpyruvate carboxykinase [Methanomassiliicoccales archaeon]
MRPEGLNELLDLVEKLPNMPNVDHPTPEQLRAQSEGFGNLTEFGNYNFCSTVRNRSAGLTVYIGDESFEEKKLSKTKEEIVRSLPKTLRSVLDYLPRVPLYYLPLTMGRNDSFSPHCSLFISRYRTDYIRLAYMVNQTLFPRTDTPGPIMNLIDLPEWQEKDRQILVFPEEHLTLVLGSDYYGEIKKGFLRMGMYAAKKQGMLGLHAGSKLIWARSAEGKVSKVGMIIFGLTATGKTTHSCHNHGLIDPGEKVRIVQDDVVFLKQNGEALGTERGFYIKTDGLNPGSQYLLYNAARSKDAILENIMVDYTGKIYFQDEVLTGNGRGIIQRDDLGEFKSESLNLPPLSALDRLLMVFITRRNTVLPIASKLTPAQAAGAFMLGESVESTGGDPKKAGESVRVVGTNPFIIGSEAGEGNWFYDFLLNNPGRVDCYQLNTGGVGELIEIGESGLKRVVRKVTRVEINEIAGVIRGISRGTIRWKKDRHFGTLIPEEVEGIDLSRLDPAKFYSDEQLARLVDDLKKERKIYLSKFSDLNPDIRAAYDL